MTTSTIDTATTVADVMSVRLVTVAPNESLLAAWELMARGGIHHLPVVVNGRCLAVVDDRTVAGALANPLALPHRLVTDVMPSRVHCILPETTLRRAAEIMHDEQVTAVPVVDQHMTLVGLVTDRDLVAAVAAGSA
jgi:CBS domain-containing protein